MIWMTHIMGECSVEFIHQTIRVDVVCPQRRADRGRHGPTI